MPLKTNIGEESLIDPKSGWTNEKELSYQEQFQENLKKSLEREKSIKKIEKDGFLCEKHLFMSKGDEESHGCLICGNNILDFRDKTYINKFDVCFECYIQNIEGREHKLEALKTE